MFYSIMAYFISFIGGLVDLIHWGIPSNWIATLITLLEYGYRLDGIVPVFTMIHVSLIIIGFEIAIFGLKVTISFLNWLRGAGGINVDI